MVWAKRSSVAIPELTLAAALALGVSGCATGTSAVAASAHGGASLYRSATAYAQLAPNEAFNPAVEMLQERDDIEITDLAESDNRCKAVAGDRKLTFRVIESANGRSRLSILVGGGDDPEANQELAESLMHDICARIGPVCERGASTQ